MAAALERAYPTLPLVAVIGRWDTRNTLQTVCFSKITLNKEKKGQVGGTKGQGFLYSRPGAREKRLIRGGFPEQERGEILEMNADTDIWVRLAYGGFARML